jgi:CubicO group peptidase (beta-lactamase class C family)
MARLVLCGLAALVIVLPAAARQDPIVTGDLAERLDRHLSRLTRFGFSGGVLVAEKGRVILKKGYGFANREAGVPFGVDTVTSVGSITKQFTGAAILKLEMQGRLRVEDPIAKYLPGVPADKRGITIHHLLTHTAGFSGDLGGGDQQPMPRDRLVAEVLAAPLASPPGERFEYSNEGYSLAAAIVEVVSGQGYEAFLREQLFLPAGMRDTGYRLPGWASNRIAVGYRPDGQAWGRVLENGWLPDGPGWYLRGNGGIHSTLDDMYRWHLALAGTTVLSAEAVRKFQTGYKSSLTDERYGYGWGVQQTRRDTQLVTHNGGNGFYFADFRRYLDEDVVIIALSNQPVVPATLLAMRDLDGLIFGGVEIAEPPAVVDVPRESRAALAGRYAVASGGQIVVEAVGDGVSIVTDVPALTAVLHELAPPGDPRFAALEARSRPIVEASAKGDFKPIFDAFNDNRPFDVVRANQARLWAQWREKWGEYQGFDILGTGAVQGDPAVTVGLRFARGTPLMRLIWGPRRLAGFAVEPPAGAVELLPESPDRYVFYRFRMRAPVRAVFERSGGGVSLSIESGALSLRASRATPPGGGAPSKNPVGG